MIFFDERFRLFFGRGGQISPNCDVISSIIDWLLIVFECTIFSMENDECDDGGVKRLTIDIEFDDSLRFDNSFGDDDDDDGSDDKHGEKLFEDITEHVESVLSNVSCLIIFGRDESEESFFSNIDDDDAHKQWPSDVISLNNVKRIGICIDDDCFVVCNELRWSESFNKRLLES